jgi:hypothetical protein
MKHGQSLEEQRRALLEHLHASRSTYREILSGDKKRGESVRIEGAIGAASLASLDPQFPRSKTIRWIMDKPYLAAAAMVGIGVVIPKLFGTGRSTARKPQEKRRRRLAGLAAFGGSTLSSLLTIGTMLLRDPATLQSVMRIACRAAAYLGDYQSRRGRQATSQSATTKKAARQETA